MKKRFFRLIIQITFLAVTGLSLFIFLVWVGFFGPVPKESDLSNIKNNLATEIFSADGVLLGRYYLQERSKTQFKEIPESVQNALIATEDVRFYSHNGIDTRSMMRVLFKTIALQNSRSGGGSTLSQQLSRNIFPREEHGLLTMPVNKVKEAIMAYRLEKIYDKEEILTLYLNTVSFGDNVFGIGMASQRFYGKHVSKLTVDEAAVLVGMLKSNYYYNPRLFPQNALKRRNVVLSQMKKYDYLSQHEFGEIAQLPIRLNYKKEAVNDGLATYFRQQVRKEVLEWCKDHKKEDGSSHNLYTDGLKIYTTIDSKLQRYAEKAVKEHMTKLQKVFDNHWKNTKPWTKEPTILETAIRNSDHYNKLKSKGNSHEKIIEAMREKHPMTLFSWSGDIERDMSSIDSIKYYLNVLQTGVLAMEPNTGDVKVWVGGIDHRYFQYDHVNKNTKRQVGSTFKPFVYAAALESGMDPCEYISGSKVAYTNLANWTPDNADTEENKMKYSYKGALAKSVNTVTVKLLEDVGLAKTILLAKNAGISSDLPEVPSLALGTASISMIEMVTAYCTFSNGGKKITPRIITQIKNHENRTLANFDNELSNKQIMSKQSALLMNHLLTSVIDNGTASRLRWKYGLKNELAGKTGTTQSNTDGWFIGYNTELVVGIWVGADNPSIRFRTTNLGSGANTALPIFAKFLQSINKDERFEQIANARFDELPQRSKRLTECELYLEDKTFFEKTFNIKRKKEKVQSKDFGKKEKKGILNKIGSFFKKKKKKNT